MSDLLLIKVTGPSLNESFSELALELWCKTKYLGIKTKQTVSAKKCWELKENNGYGKVEMAYQIAMMRDVKTEVKILTIR